MLHFQRVLKVPQSFNAPGGVGREKIIEKLATLIGSLLDGGQAFR